MIIKLTRRSLIKDFDRQIVYVNTDQITDFYAKWVNINDEDILLTNLNLVEGSMFVAESPEKILSTIQPMQYYLDTDSLSPKEKRDLCSLFLNGMYGLSVYPNPDKPTIK